MPVFAQVSEAIDQGLDLSGNLISDAVENNVPIQGAGQLTKEGFGILKALYGVMRQVHHFLVTAITMAVTEGMSEEDAKTYASYIGIGSIVATIVVGMVFLSGIKRHIFTGAIVIFLVIIAFSFLDNKLNLGW